MWVPTYGFLEELLNGDTLQGHDSTQVLGSASLGLLRQAYNPTPASKITDSSFAEANYTGYARKAVGAFTKAFKGQTNKVLVEGAGGVFQPTGSDTVNSIYGAFLTGSDSTKLLAVEMFNQPIPLPDAFSALVITVMIGVDVSGNFGSSLVSN